ncbi:cytochrome oxidase-like protein assembly factor Cox11 [Leptodontidium sp. 2 PMI_412]|nr:cytochrome oxidase-like protein assembly factor Cox11 [Leptodontidium sp. 2 PMI_412]
MNAFSRVRLGVLRMETPWTCLSCDKSIRQKSGTFFNPWMRSISKSSKLGQNTAPTYEQLRAPTQKKNVSTLYYTISIILGTVAFSYGSVPFYKMICSNGWGGQPVKVLGYDGAEGEDPSLRLKPVLDAKRIRVTFNGSVSDVLPWKFTPQQREVRVLPGESALAFYTATNESDEDIIGVATYSVTPGQAGQYFSKIQCFCFEEQRLNARETVDMPVFFYIDPDFATDPNTRGITQLTLSYTFFKAKYDKNGQLKVMPIDM